MCYSIEPRDGVLSFAKIMDKNLGKNISKKVSREYNQTLIDHSKKPMTCN